MAKTRSERTSKKRPYVAPSGQKKVEYHNRKKSKILCGICKKELMGVPKSMKRMSKSEKMPNRPYAGNYCSSCSRNVLKERIIKKKLGVE